MTRPVARATRRLVPLALGIGLLACVAARLGVRDIVGMLIAVQWTLVPVLPLYAGHQMARAAALMWCVRGRNACSFAEALWIRLSGEAVECLTFTGPMLSEPTKAWLLQRAGLDLSEGLVATLTEYLSSTVAAAVSAVVGVGYVLTALHPGGPVRIAAIVVLSSMSVFLALVTIVSAARVRIARALATACMRRVVPALEAIDNALVQTPRETPRRLLTIMTAEFVAQGFLALELWALLAGLHVSCPLARAALMEGTMKFMNAGAFLVPGQLGVAEGSYAVIFSVFGLPAAAGVTLSFARRIRTLVTAVIGALALGALRGPATRSSDAR